MEGQTRNMSDIINTKALASQDEDAVSKTMAGAGEAVALYRAILRSARLMPTKNRRAFVVKKARQEFEAGHQRMFMGANRDESNPEKIKFAMTYGETQLETIRIQAKSLTQLYNDPLYHNKGEI